MVLSNASEIQEPCDIQSAHSVDSLELEPFPK